MFDIGFLEILVILVIALLVIGPERMPEVARKLGAFMGKTKKFINSVKQEGQLQETVDELKKSMDMQEEQKQILNLEQELQESMNQSAQEIDLEEFKRPTFGGAEPASNTSGGSQFSKAPAQPVMPTSETRTQTEAPAEAAPQTEAQAEAKPATEENSVAQTESAPKPESKS